MTKLTEGLKETLGRFLRRSDDASVGVAALLGPLSDLLVLPFRAEGGFRLDPCGRGLHCSRWRLGVSSLQHPSWIWETLTQRAIYLTTE